MAVPVATPSQYVVGTVPYPIQLLGADADGTPLVFAITANPTHGTITGLNTATGACIYTPDAGYLGADSFQFTVTSGAQTSAAVTVSLIVADKKTTVSDVLLDASSNPLVGKVTFIRTGFAEGAPGLVAGVPSVSSILDSTGRFTVQVYPSTSLNPVQYYQVWYENGTRREMLGLYQVPVSDATLSLSTCPRITDTNLAAKYTFASATLMEALYGSILAQFGIQLGVTPRTTSSLQRWSGATLIDSIAKQISNKIVIAGMIEDDDIKTLSDEQFATCWFDSSGNVAFGIRKNGSLHGIEKPIRASRCFDLSGNDYFTRLVNGRWQLFKRVGTTITQYKLPGENYAPEVNGSYLYYTRLLDNGTTQYRRLLISTGADELYFGNWNALANYHHILVTGQSLSVGYQASPPLTVAQPYTNRMFSAGVMPGGSGLTSLAPLVEATVETISSAMANGLIALNNEGQSMLVSGHGVSSAPYSSIAKGTGPYASGMAQVTGGKNIAIAESTTHRVSAITVIHGEQDGANNNASYKANLVQWQADYETDCKAITGQTGTIPMFLCQIASWTKYSQTNSLVPNQQLDASVENPGKIYFVTPKYFLPYQPDGIHLTNEGERWLGEYYAQAMSAVFTGADWQPVRPLTLTRTANKIKVVFNVPYGPLVFDTVNVSDPGNYGFSYVDDSSSATITGVTIIAPDTVEITLSATPSGANKKVGYAFFGTVGNGAGPITGPRGCLRDSNPAVGASSGRSLANWCPVFQKVVS